MGLIKAALGAASSVLGDQWEEYLARNGRPEEAPTGKDRKTSFPMAPSLRSMKASV